MSLLQRLLLVGFGIFTTLALWAVAYDGLSWRNSWLWGGGAVLWLTLHFALARAKPPGGAGGG